MKKIGIYKIVNKIDGKFYIGSSNNIKSRWTRHKKLLKKNNHDNQYLQNAWNKCGETNFDFIIINECPESELLVTEQKYFDNPQLRDSLYNLSFIAGKIDMTDTIRRKIGDGNRGKIRSEATKKLLSEINSGCNHPFYGTKLSDEHKKNISKSLHGENHHMFGKHQSEETKQKMSNSNKYSINDGKFKLGHKFSDEINEKRIGSIKHFYNLDNRKKVGERIRNMYKNMSEEKRQKHRENIKKSWILRRLKKI